MSDIVERLRHWDELLRQRTPPIGGTGIIPETVAEIERLRAALEDVLSYVPHGDMPVTIYDNARAVLEGK